MILKFKDPYTGKEYQMPEILGGCEAPAGIADARVVPVRNNSQGRGFEGYALAALVAAAGAT